MMIGSTTWVSWNPSMFTLTGSITLRSSPTLKAWMTMSTTSWPLSAKKEIQPVSRIGMMSLWSFQMLIGPETARLAMIMTIGSRMAEVIGMTSLMNRSPWELVAVTTRAPVAGGAHGGTQGGMLGLHGDEGGVHAAVGDDVRQMLGHMGLRGDGIDRRHIELAESGRFRGRNRYFHSYSLAHPLILLVDHFDGARPALMGADAAPLAVVQVRLKKSVLLSR